MLRTALLFALASAALAAGAAYATGTAKPDVYTDGSSVLGPRDPYTDGGRTITDRADPFTDGGRVTDRRDVFTDGS